MSPRARVFTQAASIAALGLALVCGKVVSKHLNESAQERKTWAENLIPQGDKAGTGVHANGPGNRNLIVTLRSPEFTCDATIAAINDHSKFLAMAYEHGFESIECDSTADGRVVIQQMKIVSQKPIPRLPRDPE